MRDPNGPGWIHCDAGCGLAMADEGQLPDGAWVCETCEATAALTATKTQQARTAVRSTDWFRPLWTYND